MTECLVWCYTVDRIPYSEVFMKSYWRFLSLFFILALLCTFAIDSSAQTPKKLTIQSVTGNNLSSLSFFSADKICDGNLSTVSRGGEGGLPSWTVNLEKEYTVKEITLGSFYEALPSDAVCYYFSIWVGDSLVLEEMPCINGMQSYTLRTPSNGKSVSLSVTTWNPEGYAAIASEQPNLAEITVYGCEIAATPLPDIPDEPDKPNEPVVSGNAITGEGLSVLFPAHNIFDGDPLTYSGANYDSTIEQSWTIAFEKPKTVGEIYLCCAVESDNLGTYDVYVNGVKMNKDPLPAISDANGGIAISLPVPTLVQTVKIAIHSWENNTYVTLAEVDFLEESSTTPVCPHNFSRKVVNDAYLKEKATCKQSASYFYLCSMCDAVGTTTYQSGKTAPHQYENNQCIWCKEMAVRFVGASLTLQDNIAINFKVDSAAFIGGNYTSPLVIFQFGSNFTVVREYTLDANGRMCFTFDNLAPRMMNDIVTASLIATKDGQAVNLDTREYSIRQYCYSQLEKCMPGGALANDKTFQTLLVDLLYYGDAAQIYCGYQVDNLPSSALNATQKSWATANVPPMRSMFDPNVSIVENPLCRFTGASLILNDAVTMRFIVQADDITGITIQINSTFGNVSVPSTAFEAIGEGRYYVYVPRIGANNMRAPVLATAYKGNKPVGNTLCYSVESYAYNKLYGNGAVDGKLNALLIELMKYGVSAEKYVASH